MALVTMARRSTDVIHAKVSIFAVSAPYTCGATGDSHTIPDPTSEHAFWTLSTTYVLGLLGWFDC